MSKLLSTLFSDDELQNFKKNEELKEKEAELFHSKWRDWLEKNEQQAIGQLESQKMFQMLKTTDPDDILIIKPTKKNLNQIIKFSSSRFNEFKKSDYVNSCYNAIKNADKNVPYNSVMEVTTGCFSSGAFGISTHNSKVFNAKFTNSGQYYMSIPYGLPFLILDNYKIVIFDGFVYEPIEIDQDLLRTYSEYKNGSEALKTPF